MMTASLIPVKDPQRRDKRRRGSAILEFVLAGTFIFLPMLAGLATVGMSMMSANQVASLNTSAGQMFSTGVDFTDADNVNILQKIAGTLNTNSSGGGVVILTEIDDTGSGPVCATPITIQIGAGGTGTSGCAAVTALMSGMLNGQIAYLAETYYNNPQFSWAFAPAGTGSGIYVKAVF